MSGTTLVVGTPHDDTVMVEAGSAYVFDLAGATPDVPVLTLGNPVVNQGDSLVHVAVLKRVPTEGAAELLEAELQSDPLFDEDEII